MDSNGQVAVVPTPVVVTPPPISPVQTTLGGSVNVMGSKSSGGGVPNKLGPEGLVAVGIVSVLILAGGIIGGVMLAQRSQTPKTVEAAYLEKLGGASFGWDGACYSTAETPASTCIVVLNHCPLMTLETFRDTTTACNCVVTGPGPNDVDCSGNTTPGTGPVTRQVLVGLGNDLPRCWGTNNYCGVQQLDANCSGVTSFRSVFSDEPPQCVGTPATPTPTPVGSTPVPTSSCPDQIDPQFWYDYDGVIVENATTWFGGAAITTANPTRPFYLDINCFAFNGGGAFTNARIELDGPNGRILDDPDWAARNVQISLPGYYTARCIDKTLGTSCYNADEFTLVAPATPTPTPTPTLPPGVTPTVTPTPIPVPQQCQNIEIYIGTALTPTTADKIQLGDTVTFRGYAIGAGVTGIRFTLTKDGVVQPFVDRSVVPASTPNTVTADYVIVIDSATSYSVAILPLP